MFNLTLNTITVKLKDSKYGSEEAINEIVKAFDSRSKRIFRSETETIYLPFGMPSFKDPSVGIVGGKLKLPGYVLLSKSLIKIRLTLAGPKSPIYSSHPSRRQ